MKFLCFQSHIYKSSKKEINESNESLDPDEYSCAVYLPFLGSLNIWSMVGDINYGVFHYDLVYMMMMMEGETGRGLLNG